MAELRDHWHDFFNTTGAAGATLIGLLFVTVTLVSGLSKSQSASGIRAFLTPTLLNFSAVLFQALIVEIPWPSNPPLGVILILAGLAGLAYRINTKRFKQGLDFIQVKTFDWIPYDGAPMLAYACLIAGGIGLLAEGAFAPFAVAVSSLLLLAAGIYGAWDLTLWMVKNRKDT